MIPSGISSLASADEWRQRSSRSTGCISQQRCASSLEGLLSPGSAVPFLRMPSRGMSVKTAPASDMGSPVISHRQILSKQPSFMAICPTKGTSGHWTHVPHVPRVRLSTPTPSARSAKSMLLSPRSAGQLAGVRMSATPTAPLAESPIKLSQSPNSFSHRALRTTPEKVVKLRRRVSEDSPTKKQGLQMVGMRLNGPVGSIDLQEFDIRTKLMAAIGADPLSRVEVMTGFHGGQNEGIWFVQSQGKEMVLKVVQGKSRHPTMLSESDNLLKIYAEHPEVVADQFLAFPTKIVRVQDHSGNHLCDVMVMPRAKGQMLAFVIHELWHKRNFNELMRIFKRVGSCIAGFHRRYQGKQHGDLQPANIVYDCHSGQITLIDLGGMGSNVMKSDEEHFLQSLTMLATYLGCPRLANDAQRHFSQAYTFAKNS